jgi:hypothetical protein
MTKRNRIIYWVSTLWLALGMVSTGLGQLVGFKGQGDAEMLMHLGYPLYLLTILGVWKMLGVAAILIHTGEKAFLKVLNEWAYAGFFFVMSGAILSHMASGDPFTAVLPALLLLVLTVLSWYFRPANRKIIS